MEKMQLLAVAVEVAVLTQLHQEVLKVAAAVAVLVYMVREVMELEENFKNLVRLH
jgi:hypothetical protein